jgi:hypothetical protein
MIDEVAAVVGEALTPQADREFVGRPAEVAHVEFMLWESGVQQRLEVPEILHPLGEGVAHDHDMVVWLEFEPGRLGGGGDRGHEDGQQRSDSPREPHRMTNETLRHEGLSRLGT